MDKNAILSLSAIGIPLPVKVYNDLLYFMWYRMIDRYHYPKIYFP